MTKIADVGMSSARGIAAVIVVIAHSIQIFIIRLIGLDHVIAEFAGLMAVWAVSSFFIISGLLITKSVIRNIEVNNGIFDLISYASSRISRIYPPLILSIAISVFINFILIIFELPGAGFILAEPYGLPGDLYAARHVFSISANDIKNALLMNNGFLQVNGPLWSLCVEWRIYIVVACLAMLITSKSLIHGVLWGVLLLLSLILLKTVDSNGYFYFLIWLLGCCIAIGKIFEFKYSKIVFRLLLIFALFVIVAVLFSNPKFLLSSRALISFWERAFQFVCCTFLLGLFFLQTDLRDNFVRRMLMRLGDFSYTLYIIHFPIMLLSLSLSQKVIGYSLSLSVLAAFLSICIVLVVSSYAGRYVERKDFVLPFVQKGLQFLLSRAAPRT